jgi:hypothetical protein
VYKLHPNFGVQILVKSAAYTRTNRYTREIKTISALSVWKLLNWCNKIFSGDQPCQFGARYWHFSYPLCLHHQGMLWWVTTVCYIINAPSHISKPFARSHCTWNFGSIWPNHAWAWHRAGRTTRFTADMCYIWIKHFLSGSRYSIRKMPQWICRNPTNTLNEVRFSSLFTEAHYEAVTVWDQLLTVSCAQE